MDWIFRAWLVAVTVAMALGAQAQESPEVVVVLDGAPGSFTSSIKRFDGFSGQFLGEFGRSTLINPQGIAVFGSEVAVLDQTPLGRYIRRFDFHSGRYLGAQQLQSAALGIKRTSDGLISYDTFTINRYVRSGNTFSLAQSFAHPFGTITSIALSNDGSTYMVGAGNRRALLRASDGTIFNDFTASVEFNAGAITPYENGFIAIFNSGLETFLSRIPTVAIGGFATSTTVVRDQARGVAMGHTDLGYFGTTLSSTGQAVIGRVSAVATSPFYSGSFGAGNLSAVRDLDVYLAPEPGTLLALGVGTLGLLARRRRKQ